jgi:hypothetical protein
MSIGTIIRIEWLTGCNRRRRRRRFLRRAGEMTVAMLLGMVVLGMTFRQLHIALFGTAFDDAMA